LNLSDGGYNM